MASTSTISEDGLFRDSLLSSTLTASLPPSYILRPLRKSDYTSGFLDCLQLISDVGSITEKAWNERYDWMATKGEGTYYIVVIEHQDQVVGTGRLVIERKL